MLADFWSQPSYLRIVPEREEKGNDLTTVDVICIT